VRHSAPCLLDDFLSRFCEKSAGKAAKKSRFFLFVFARFLSPTAVFASFCSEFFAFFPFFVKSFIC